MAVPFLVEVPISRAGMDELLPPRIAPQLRSYSAGSAASEQTAAAAAAAVASTISAAEGGGQPGGHGAAAMALDSVDSLGPVATETLHFFGVFDGHGGADAALHCAKSLHERVREVLSATAAVLGPAALLSLRSKEHLGSGGAAAAEPQASSSSQAGGQHGGGAARGDAASSRLSASANASAGLHHAGEWVGGQVDPRIAGVSHGGAGVQRSGGMPAGSPGSEARRFRTRFLHARHARRTTG